jgi:Low psii accumulation1 / Rep27
MCWKNHLLRILLRLYIGYCIRTMAAVRAFVLASLLAFHTVQGFHCRATVKSVATAVDKIAWTESTMWMSQNDERLDTRREMSDSKGSAPEYSRDLLLREEAESPFRKIRFFAYASLGAAAVTSFLISITRVAAALSGINTDLLNESSINAGVDLAGIIVLAALWQRDVQAQDSRLKRAAKGAELAKLMVRGSKAMMAGYLADGMTESEMQDATAKKSASDSFTTTLASMRRGRGIEKRVVIAAGSKEKIDAVLKEAILMQDTLLLNDLLIVPVVVPQCTAPTSVDSANDLPPCVALPVGTSSWKYVVGDEMEQAVSQGIDVMADGFCIILKKNGRVGQRTKGIYLQNLAGNVERRREAGMDVKNI